MLVMFGVALIVIGFFFILREKLPWIGRLPGDISIQKEGFRFYFPITTSLLISAITTLILFLFRK